MPLRLRYILSAVTPLAILTGCQDPEWANKQALLIGSPLPDAAQIRERETDVFHVRSETQLLSEATQVLQDLGFTIEESAPRYGVLAGSKNRDATETGQVVGQIALAVGLALIGAHYDPTWDTDQVIRATLVTRPVDSSDVRLRISFERIVTNNKGVSRVELLTDAQFSQGFFEKVRHGLATEGV